MNDRLYRASDRIGPGMPYRGGRAIELVVLALDRARPHAWLGGGGEPLPGAAAEMPYSENVTANNIMQTCPPRRTSSLM